MNKKLLALYGLKWNPFSPELPTEAVFIPQKVESFLWRIEHSQVRERGFALITGDPGTGKSVVLRLLAERLEHLREITNPSGCSSIPRRTWPISMRNGRYLWGAQTQQSLGRFQSAS